MQKAFPPVLWLLLTALCLPGCVDKCDNPDEIFIDPDFKAHFLPGGVGSYWVYQVYTPDSSYIDTVRVDSIRRERFYDDSWGCKTGIVINVVSSDGERFTIRPSPYAKDFSRTFTSILAQYVGFGTENSTTKIVTFGNANCDIGSTAIYTSSTENLFREPFTGYVHTCNQSDGISEKHYFQSGAGLVLYYRQKNGSIIYRRQLIDLKLTAL